MLPMSLKIWFAIIRICHTACCTVFGLLFCCDSAVICQVMMHRFFCGPHAKKSAALAKQQKKKPKGKGKTVEEPSEHSLHVKPALCCAVLCCAEL